MRIVRAAVVQDHPIVFDREATIEKVNTLVSEAARQGATLVVLPEAFVSAYPTGLGFGARICDGRGDCCLRSPSRSGSS